MEHPAPQGLIARAISRPIGTTLLTLLVCLVGAVCFVRIPVALLPDVSLPTLRVDTEYPDAAPEEVERLVTRIVESAVGATPGVVSMHSVSTTGRSEVQIDLAWGANLDAVANDVRDRLDRVQDELPDDIPRSRLRKFDPTAAPVLILSIGSALPPLELAQLVEDRVQSALERIDGVAEADIWGNWEREIQVAIDPDRLRAFGLPLDDVLRALREANVDVPGGDIERGDQVFTLRTSAAFARPQDLQAVPVARRDGNPIRLDQLATIRDTHRKMTRIVRIDGEAGVRMGLRKQADANTVAVCERARKALEQLQADLPQMNLRVVVDQGAYIQRAIDNVIRSAIAGGMLAMLVLMAFLGRLRPALIIGTAIPVSVLATFGLMAGLGFTLNLMTLGGLALGVGMMVDSAIVVLENIVRRRGLGETQAARDGSREVASALVASTLTTIVIFLPLLALRGVTGILFGQLGLVVVCALIASLIVSLTLIPMLAERWLPARHPSALQRSAESVLGSSASLYRRLLERALQQPVTVIMAMLMLVAAAGLLSPQLGRELMPAEDEGEVRLTADLPAGTRLSLVDHTARLLEQEVAGLVPEAQTMVTNVGTGGGSDSATRVDVRVYLGPVSQRSRSNQEVADALRQNLGARFPGVVLRTRAPQGLFVVSRLLEGGDPLVVEIAGDNFQMLSEVAQQAEQVLSAVPGVVDVQRSVEPAVPEIVFSVNREAAADAGLSVASVARLVETSLSGSLAGNLRAGNDTIPIRVQLDKPVDLAPELLLDLTLPGPGGADIALRNLVEQRRQAGAARIERQEQRRVMRLTGSFSGSDPGSLAAAAQEALRTLPLPEGIDITLRGDWEEQQRADRELRYAILFSLVLVFLVLGCQYESLRDPLVVMCSVPAAGIGVVLMLWLTGTTFNLQSGIGCMMLGGIVVNNAILLVDQTNQLRSQGHKLLDAILLAGEQRLRPILMTTATTLLALIPLALALGEGAQAQAPLARAVLGGLLSSTVVTLFLVPCVYKLAHRSAPS